MENADFGASAMRETLEELERAVATTLAQSARFLQAVPTPVSGQAGGGARDAVDDAVAALGQR